MANNLFPKIPNVIPKIYGYIDRGYEGFVKVGYTEINVEERIKQ